MAEQTYIPRMKQQYLDVLKTDLTKEFGYKNAMEVPRIEKVVINMGLGEAIQNIKVLESAVDELSRITGQKAVITKAKKSLGYMPVGTLEEMLKVLMAPRILGFFGLLTSTVMNPVPADGAHVLVAKPISARPGFRNSTSLSLPGQCRKPTSLGLPPLEMSMMCMPPFSGIVPRLGGS